MATLEELRLEIKAPLKDSSITDDFIDAKINECLRYLARKLLVPALESSNVFTTEVGVAEVDIPIDWNYSRNLFHASVVDGNPITVLSSIGLLVSRYPNYDVDLDEGSIEFVTIKGTSLVYYPIPAEATEVTCKFYAVVTPLINDTDEPTFLPPEMHIDLIVNFVLWKIWARIEDGMEGIKVNTQYHKSEFLTYFEELDDMVDIGQSRATPHRENSWI